MSKESLNSKRSLSTLSLVGLAAMTSVFQTDSVSSTLTRGSQIGAVGHGPRRVDHCEGEESRQGCLRSQVWSGGLMAGRRSYKPDVEGSIPSPTT